MPPRFFGFWVGGGRFSLVGNRHFGPFERRKGSGRVFRPPNPPFRHFPDDQNALFASFSPPFRACPPLPHHQPPSHFRLFAYFRPSFRFPSPPPLPTPPPFSRIVPPSPSFPLPFSDGRIDDLAIVSPFCDFQWRAYIKLSLSSPSTFPINFPIFSPSPLLPSLCPISCVCLLSSILSIDLFPLALCRR